MIEKQDQAILEHVLNAFCLPGLPPITLSKQINPRFAEALIKALDTVGWSLQYDPAHLDETIRATREHLGPPPPGVPALPPEELKQ
jgi:hypothetical protein